MTTRHLSFPFCWLKIQLFLVCINALIRLASIAIKLKIGTRCIPYQSHFCRTRISESSWMGHKGRVGFIFNKQQTLTLAIIALHFLQVTKKWHPYWWMGWLLDCLASKIIVLYRESFWYCCISLQANTCLQSALGCDPWKQTVWLFLLPLCHSFFWDARFTVNV